MAELKQIHDPGLDCKKPHVIFVHGLGGDIRKTWMHNPRDHATLWPAWVGEDSGCPVWLLGYDAALSGWVDGAMPLPDQGTSVLDALTSEPRLKEAPLVMVGHSLGGLVIKTALVNASSLGVARYSNFERQLRGVIFVATPHFGSELATLADVLKVILRTNDQVGDLRAHDPYLGILNTQFRSLHQRLGFGVRAFRETRGVATSRRLFGLVRGPTVIVVSATSSDPYVQGETAIPLPEDHFSICKPKDKNTQIHKSLVDFLLTMPLAQQLSPPVGDTSVDPPFSPVKPQEPGELLTLDESVDPENISLRRTQLAFAEVGLNDPMAVVIVSVCVVTDEATHLVDEINDWKTRVLRDPLLPEPVKQRARRANLVALFDEPALRPQLLGWLSVTSFSGYLYYARRDALDHIPADEINRRFLVEPLVHRISKKSELIERSFSERDDLLSLLKDAARTVLDRFNREVEVPEVTRGSSHESRALIELAHLVAAIGSRYLTMPANDDAATAFAHVRTRIRFAQNVVSGEVHTRDRNPLP